MPRRFTVPAYQLHRGSGQAKVRIQGKDIYLGPHGSPESRERYEGLSASSCPTASGPTWPGKLRACETNSARTESYRQVRTSLL